MAQKAAPEIRRLSSITDWQARFKITPGVIEPYLATAERSLMCRALEKTGAMRLRLRFGAEERDLYGA